MAHHGPLQLVNVSPELGELQCDAMFQVWQHEIVTSSADCAFTETTQDIAAVAQLLTHIQLTGRGYFQSHTLASKISAYVAACVYSTLNARL